MRLVRLGRIIVSAEALRIRHRARRTSIRIVLFCFAGVLALGALAFGHIALWFWLRESLSRQGVALIFTGADLVVAIILVVVAANYGPGRIERQALAIRERAWEGAAASMAMSAVVMRLVQLLFRSGPRR